MILLFVVLQLLDVLSTEIGLTMGHVEANPLYHTLGALPFYLIKAAVVIWSVAMLTLLPGQFTLKRVILLVLVAVSSLTLLRNIVILSSG